MKPLLLFLVTVTCNTAGLNFPTVRYSVSPDFRWLVRCVTEKRADGFQHAVLLSRFGETTDQVVWISNRSCDVLWAEDSLRLAITDWTGSNLSEIYVMDVTLPRVRSLDVGGVEKLVRKDELEGHCYYEALRWESGSRLAIRIFGHTDVNPSHGFAYYLSVDTQSGAATLVRKEDEEPDLRPVSLKKSAPVVAYR